jgi:hypothetical protein
MELVVEPADRGGLAVDDGLVDGATEVRGEVVEDGGPGVDPGQFGDCGRLGGHGFALLEGLSAITC